MTSPLAEHFRKLDRFEQRVPLEFVEDWLRDDAVSLYKLREFLRFHPSITCGAWFTAGRRIMRYCCAGGMVSAAPSTITSGRAVA